MQNVTRRPIDSQSARLLTGLAAAGTMDGGARFNVTCDALEVPTFLNQRGIQLVVCRRNYCHATHILKSHPQPPQSFTHDLHWPPIDPQGNWTPISMGSPLVFTPQRSPGPETPPVVTRPPWNRVGYTLRLKIHLDTWQLLCSFLNSRELIESTSSQC